MTLDEVPAVRIDCWYKFAVAELVSLDGTTKIVIRSGHHYHRDIYRALVGELRDSGITIRCYLGGGFIWKDEARKIISIYGSSSQYGQEPSRSETVHLIQAVYPDFKVFG